MVTHRNLHLWRAAAPLHPGRTSNSGGLFLRRKACLLIGLYLLLGGFALSYAADPYAAALDQRFVTTNVSTEPTAADVAAMEEALKKQVHQMSQKPEPSTAGSADSFEHFLLGAFVMAGVLVAALAALAGLRRWNQRIDQREAARIERLQNAIAEDPLMVEFLRTLREDPNLAIAPAVSARASSFDLESASAPQSQTLHSAESLAREAAAVANYLAQLRAEFQKVRRAGDEAERVKILRELLERAEVIKQACAQPELRSVRLLTSALQGLLKQFSLKAANITPSGMRTAAAALDLLEVLCKTPSRPDLATVPPVRMLAVDDDAITRRAVSLCLKKAFNEPDVAPEGRTALALAEQQSYDIIFLDIEMPGMDGLELCAKIHETEQNRSTPVVFVTSHTDFESRAKSAMLGAQDLIGKPFLTFEITVKALTVVLKARHASEAKGASNLNEPKKANSFVSVRSEVVAANRLPAPPVPEPSGQPA